MEISEKAWDAFIKKLRIVNEAAAQKILDYIAKNDILTPLDRQALISYAYAIAVKYGEGAAALACAMYDATAAAQGAAITAAIPAATPSVAEVAKTINGTLKTGNANIVADSIGRLVKQTGVDTTLKNALRDGIQWAWVPRGETCAFCIMLASNGWQRASLKALKGGHAEHIHANCDCTYAVRFDGKSTVAGYDPDKYAEMMDIAYDQGGPGWTGAVNYLRREFYAEDKEKINAQKRDNYEKRKERESSAAEETIVS